jgi:hypothetical protein
MQDYDRGMKARTIAGTGLLLAAAVMAYLKLGRRRVLNWGATQDEVQRSMPGDEVLRDAALQTTRAITIEAGPGDIWPWLVQMGPRPRAGAYTYDWIERLLGIDIKNADRILPEYQRLEPGDAWGLNEKGQGIRVLEVTPQEAIVLQWVPARSTWTFALYPENGRTRLVSRNRLPGSGPFFWLSMAGFMEPCSLVMERKMLLGIKERAERWKRSASTQQATGADRNPEALAQHSEPPERSRHTGLPPPW